MRNLDLYVIRKTLWPLLAALGVALIALLLERTVRLLDLVVSEGGPFYLLLRMVANLIPHYLGLALPAAFFLGSLLAVMRLASESELDVMQAAGYGLNRLLLPLMGLGIVLTLCSAIVIGYLQPHTRYAYRALKYLVTNTAWNIALERDSIFTGFHDMAISVEDIADRGRHLTGIFVNQRRPDGRTITTTAQSGKVLRSVDKQRLVLNLEKGVLVETKEGSTSATVITFDHMNVPLDVDLTPEAFRQNREGYREMTLLELWQALDAPPIGTTANGAAGEIHGRLVRIATVLFLPLLTVPLGAAARRGSRIYGLAMGMGIIVFYNYLLEFGDGLVVDAGVSPWLALWGPYLIFGGGSAWACYRACTRPGANAFSAAIATGERALGAMQWAAAHRSSNSQR
jgi:lipopolysaccharide export system permease protein